MSGSTTPRSRTSPLASARLKLSRALEHLLTLNAEEQQFWLSYPGEIEIVYDGDSGEHIARWSKLIEPPPRLGLIVGDLAHNARAALDYAVYSLSATRNTMPTSTYFPIHADDATYERDHRSAVRFLSPDEAAVVRRSQPMSAGEPARSSLELLRRLSNTDKHRFLQPALAFLRSGAARFRRIGGEITDTTITARANHGDLLRLSEGAELLRVRVDPPYDGPLEADIGGEVFVAFGEEPLRGRDLQAMIDTVDEILGALEAVTPDVHG